jgi:hypothetical protein
MASGNIVFVSCVTYPLSSPFMANELVLVGFYFVTLVYSVIIHEVSHGIAALWLGDLTAKYAGRLNLNPMKHIDPIGSIIVPISMFFLFHFAFGWAKPVPYNPYNLRNQKWGPALVAIAGPVSNILLALSAVIVAKLLPLSVRSRKQDVSPYVSIGVVIRIRGLLRSMGIVRRRAFGIVFERFLRTLSPRHLLERAPRVLQSHPDSALGRLEARLFALRSSGRNRPIPRTVGVFHPGRYHIHVPGRHFGCGLSGARLLLRAPVLTMRVRSFGPGFTAC